MQQCDRMSLQPASGQSENEAIDTDIASFFCLFVFVFCYTYADALSPSHTDVVTLDGEQSLGTTWLQRCAVVAGPLGLLDHLDGELDLLLHWLGGGGAGGGRVGGVSTLAEAAGIGT